MTEGASELCLETPSRKDNMLCISSYSFRGNYSFLNLEIQRSQYIRPKVTVHKGAETIQGRKLYKEIRYSFVHNFVARPEIEKFFCFFFEIKKKKYEIS